MGKIKIIIGINDLTTIRPDVAALLANPEDGYNYVAGAAAYVWFKCPACGELVYRQIADMCKRNFVCPKCQYGSRKPLVNPRKLSQEKFLDKLHKTTPGVFTDDVYINSKTEIDFYCNQGHHWINRPEAQYGLGCPYCSGHRPIIGETDLGTTRPDVAKLLKYPERAVLYKEYSNQYEEFICPNCGKKLNRLINNVSHKGLHCENCGDGLSYPNKFMANILTQLGIRYKTEYIIKPKNYKYDFYLFDYNTIIEMHGQQHYEECTLTSRTLAEEQENDKIKYEYAIKNNIGHYVVIDSRKSIMQYLKDHIMASYLAEILNLSDIDWGKCELFASGTMVTIAADLYDQGFKFSEIMSKLQVSKSAVTNWLNKADNIGLIVWDKHNGFKDLCKPVILLNTNEIFPSIAKGAKAYDVDKANLVAVCNHEKLYAGIHPITMEPLVWRFLDNYDVNEVVDFASIKLTSRDIKKYSINNTKLIKEVS